MLTQPREFALQLGTTEPLQLSAEHPLYERNGRPEWHIDEELNLLLEQRGAIAEDWIADVAKRIAAGSEVDVTEALRDLHRIDLALITAGAARHAKIGQGLFGKISGFMYAKVHAEDPHRGRVTILEDEGYQARLLESYDRDPGRVVEGVAQYLTTQRSRGPGVSLRQTTYGASEGLAVPFPHDAEMRVPHMKSSMIYPLDNASSAAVVQRLPAARDMFSGENTYQEQMLDEPVLGRIDGYLEYINWGATRGLRNLYLYEPSVVAALQYGVVMNPQDAVRTIPNMNGAIYRKIAGLPYEQRAQLVLQ